MQVALWPHERLKIEKQFKQKITTGMRAFFCGELKEKIKIDHEEHRRVLLWTDSSHEPGMSRAEWWMKYIFTV